MARNTSVVPKAPLGRILMVAGAKRVSQGALDEFSKRMEEFATAVAAKAVKFAQHAGRVTVHDDDVRLAAKEESQ